MRDESQGYYCTSQPVCDTTRGRDDRNEMYKSDRVVLNETQYLPGQCITNKRTISGMDLFL
jgi:hypothetical protein